MAEWPKQVHPERLDAFDLEHGSGYVWVIPADLGRELQGALKPYVEADEGKRISRLARRRHYEHARAALARYEREVGDG